MDLKAIHNDALEAARAAVNAAITARTSVVSKFRKYSGPSLKRLQDAAALLDKAKTFKED